MQGIYQEVSGEMAVLFYRGFTLKEITAFERTLTQILYNLETSERS